jgi:hypothetical protein
MKLIPALAVFILSALVAIPGAMSQAVVLKADIPFAFTVGDTAMPAGEYTISSRLSGVLQVQNTDKHVTASVTTAPGYHDAGRSNKLEFARYGDQYFLHRIFCPATTSMNVQIPVWKAEKHARERAREAKLDRGEKTLVAVK